jgi:hypothetical protein
VFKSAVTAKFAQTLLIEFADHHYVDLNHHVSNKHGYFFVVNAIAHKTPPYKETNNAFKRAFP